jgi:hypothetical protein
MFDQVAQTTACNHVHSVQQRMCRWLLTTHDRVGSSEFHLTQEFLAQMLGVRRPSVTVAAASCSARGSSAISAGASRSRTAPASRPAPASATTRCEREFDRLLAAVAA